MLSQIRTLFPKPAILGGKGEGGGAYKTRNVPVSGRATRVQKMAEIQALDWGRVSKSLFRSTSQSKKKNSPSSVNLACSRSSDCEEQLGKV